jgi:Zn-dependent protease
MGIMGAAGLFASIIFHEFSHSLIARRFGMPMKGITLFIFGGVAEMDEEPPSARAEFYMSVAGPLASIFIGALFGGIYAAGEQIKWSIVASGTFRYLFFINFLLAGFNLLPAFPLDGGRVLRSALWGWKGNINWATHIASQIGSGFGLIMIFLGIFYVISGVFIGGLWWFLIGLFLRNASRMSYTRLVVQETLAGEPVRRFMKTDPVTVPPGISLQEFVDRYLYTHHFKMYPVVQGDSLKGVISTREIKQADRSQWEQKTVGDVMQECSENNVVSPDTDSMKALSLMHRTGTSRLLVVDQNRLEGIVVLKDLLRFLSLKLDLEDRNLSEMDLQRV